MEHPWYRWQGDDLILSLRLQPRASRDEVVGVQGDALKIRITAPPVDGKANSYLIKFLAKLFDVPTARVTLLSGDTARDKRVCISRPGRLINEVDRL